MSSFHVILLFRCILAKNTEFLFLQTSADMIMNMLLPTATESRLIHFVTL